MGFTDTAMLVLSTTITICYLSSSIIFIRAALIVVQIGYFFLALHTGLDQPGMTAILILSISNSFIIIFPLVLLEFLFLCQGVGPPGPENHGSGGGLPSSSNNKKHIQFTGMVGLIWFGDPLRHPLIHNLEGGGWLKDRSPFRGGGLPSPSTDLDYGGVAVNGAMLKGSTKRSGHLLNVLHT